MGHGHTARGFEVTFALVFMLSLNPPFPSGEIGLKGVPSSWHIQLVRGPGLGAGSRGLAGLALVPAHAQRHLLCSHADTTAPRFQRDVFIYGFCMNCTPQVTCKNLKRADDLNTY